MRKTALRIGQVINNSRVKFYTAKENDMSEYYEQVKKAVIWLTINHPFFSSILLKRPLVATDTIPTASTDGSQIWFNPEFLEHSMPQAHTTFVLVHEVMHIVFKHHLRRGGRKPGLWNKACDYSINGMLVDMGLSMPDKGLHNIKYAGMTPEAIYDALVGTDEDDADGAGDVGDPGGCGGVMDAKDMSDSGRAQAEAEVNMDIASAAQAAKSCGSMPGGLEGLIDAALTPKVDWRAHLWNFVNTVSKDDYSYQRLNKNYMSQGIVVPDLYSEAIGTIAVLVDTSGSVSNDELEQFCGEITSILETYPATIQVVYVDTQVNGDEVFTRNDLPIAMNVKGRGGTCFKPGFAWLDENGVDPACIIYLTDMECNSFPSPPNAPTLWVSTEAYGHGCDAPFGITTFMG